MPIFPSPEWLPDMMTKLNQDEKYGRIASKWEGDLLCVVEADQRNPEPIAYYFDLWHGKCRQAYETKEPETLNPVLKLNAPFSTFVKILSGDLEILQAFMTRKVSVKGNMGLLMKNIPTVLEFVRCAREVTEGIVPDVGKE